MRLTRGCRAGGGVACSSLEYGGIRAATRRTPAPHDRLLLAFSASSRPPRPSPFHPRRALPLSSPATLSPRNIGAVLQALPLPLPLPPALPRSRILRRHRTDNGDDDDDDVPISLRRILASLLYIWQRDGQDGQKKEGRSRKWRRKGGKLCLPFQGNALKTHLPTMFLSPRRCGYIR